MPSPPIRRALVSVSDKSGLIELAQGLAAAEIEIVSTGGTRRHLEQAGITVCDVVRYTGFPEIMDGRVKTLHPKIYAGLLCRHDHPADLQVLAEHNIATIELVVVNLYPFRETIAREGVTPSEAIEQIDIGGPSMVRAAAKNHAFTTIATHPDQYAEILAEIRAAQATTLELRRRLAAAAFAHTADYDCTIADWFESSPDSGALPSTFRLAMPRVAELRYGENPHQRAALYRDPDAPGGTLAAARQLAGKELSYNNLLDLEAASSIVRSLPEHGVAVIKHNNPCGAAVDADQALAVRRALEGDPVSAFGSILGFNSPVSEAAAEVLAEPGLFVEAIVAPRFDPVAVEILTTRPKWRRNVRLLETPGPTHQNQLLELRRIDGGLLVQDADCGPDPEDEWKLVTESEATPQQLDELRFAWAAVRYVKSNAIVLCRDRALCGVGAGQMSRVDSVQIAIRKAGDRAAGSVLASDAFFPFPDSIHTAADAGVVAVIQPGGSRNDDEVIAACNERGLPMIVTARRHFKH